MASQSGTAVAAPWLVRAPIQKARPMIKTLAQSGKHSATLEFFDVHSHCSVLKWRVMKISTILVCYFCMSFLFFQGETVQTYLKKNQWEKWQLISITIGFSGVVNLIVKWESVDSRENYLARIKCDSREMGRNLGPWVQKSTYWVFISTPSQILALAGALWLEGSGFEPTRASVFCPFGNNTFSVPSLHLDTYLRELLNCT